MNATRRCLRLTKGRHHFVFWYYAGQESQVMACLIGMAQGAEGEFDWFDAAVLTHEVVQPQVPCAEAVVT